MLDYYVGDSVEVCPICKKESYFHFIRKDTNLPIGDLVGYCTDNQCEYCCLPEEFYSYRNQLVYRYASREVINLGQDSSSRDSLDYYISRFWVCGKNCENNLFIFLKTIFQEQDIENVFNRYFVQTSLFDKWENGCIFWRITTDGKKLAYKLIQFHKDGPREGHRNQEIHILQHSLIDNKHEQRYCLFGLHLLNDPKNGDKKICIVESEKTALIASIVYPQGLWLATGSCRYLNKMNINDIPDERMKDVILFPDPDLEGDVDESGKPDDWNARKNWYDCLRESNISGFMKKYVEDNKRALIQEHGEDKYYETDLADYIIRTIRNRKELASFEEIIKP